jgi:hypothetical protein
MTNGITNVPDVIPQFPTDDGTLHSLKTLQERRTPFFGGILARHRPSFVGTLVKIKVCRVNQTEKCSMKMSYRNIPTEMLESGPNEEKSASVRLGSVGEHSHPFLSKVSVSPFTICHFCHDQQDSICPRCHPTIPV